MKHLLFLFTIMGLVSASEAYETLDCEFTVFGAPFMSTVSELNEDQSIGMYSTARIGPKGEGKQVPNKVHGTNGDEIYSFELNEVEGGENIHLFVYQDFSALALNPQDPITGKQKGTCGIVNK